MAVTLVVVSIVVVCLTFLIIKLERWRRKIPKIPGPPTIPILGNAHQLSTDARILTQQLLALTEEYSHFGIVRFWLCYQPLVGILKAEWVETLLNSSKHIDKADEYKFLYPWLGTGLLTSTGNKWKTRRRLLTPTFHFKILHDFTCVFNDQADVLTKKLQTVANKGKFDIFPFITLCALDIICETAMGRSVNAQSNSEGDYVQAVYKITLLILLRIRSPWYWPDFLFNTIGPGKQHDKYLKTLHSFTEKVIRERSAEFSEKKDGAKSMEEMIEGRADDDDMYVSKGKRLAFLDMLLCATTPDGSSLSFEDIREEVDTFMFEGHDTTAAGLGFAIHLIGANPHVQERLHEEMDTIFGDDDRPATMKDLKEMKYLECTIKESLRLYPSVPFYGRKITDDLRIGDKYDINKGTTVVISAGSIHRNERYFPDPEKFDPERFLPENTGNRHPYAFIPFSAGPRNCIGQKFAMLEEKVILSSILRKFKITSLQDHDGLEPAVEIILRAESGIQVTLESR